MQGQEFDMCDLPFDGYNAPERKYKPWGCPRMRHHDGKPGYGPFGRPGFDQGPGNPGFYGPDHHRFGPPEDGQRRPRCGWWGPPKREGDGLPDGVLFHGPPGFRPGHDGTPHEFHGPPGFRPGHDGAPHEFHGPPGFRPGHDGRPHEFHGHGAGSNNYGPPGWWFGRRGASESAERPWGGPWGGPDHRP